MTKSISLASSGRKSPHVNLHSPVKECSPVKARGSRYFSPDKGVLKKGFRSSQRGSVRHKPLDKGIAVSLQSPRSFKDKDKRYCSPDKQFCSPNKRRHLSIQTLL